MKIETEEYLQKLVQIYQAQCNQYLQERISLQAQLDLVLQKIEELEAKSSELEEAIDVNSNTHT